MVQREKLEPSGPRCISIALIHCPSCVNANEERQKIMSGKGCFTTVTRATLSSLQGESGAPGENGAPGPMVSSAAHYCLNMETKIVVRFENELNTFSWHRDLVVYLAREAVLDPVVLPWVSFFSHLTTCIQPDRLELANFSCADLLRVPVVTMAWPVLPVPQ